jgi:hemerythrin
MALRWKEDLTMGVAELDRQHRELFDCINRLLDACRVGKGSDQVQPVLQFLESYVREHFAEEERRMREAGYPLLALHKAQHDGFLVAFEDVKKDASSPGLALTFGTNRLLTDWWINHISGTDREFGRYLAGRRQGAPG